jgi:hypothetical protein
MSHYLARRRGCPLISKRGRRSRAEQVISVQRSDCQGPGLDKLSGTTRHLKGGKTVSRNHQQYAGDRARLEGRTGKRAACGTAP